MATQKQTHVQHLQWRAGFGPSASDYNQLHTSPDKVYKAMRQASASPPKPIAVAEQLRALLLQRDTTSNSDKEETKQARVRDLARQMREGIKTINLTWLDNMVESEASLREKMALFWHGHFACRNNNAYFQQELLNTIRANALGDFKSLLFGVSQSAAMLAFLNNQQNRKAKPNENFARELMELFTLGTGSYTEADVKAGARAFTGWGFNLQGEFVFRKNLHDDGQKEFLGRKGNFNGDDIINILLEKKETATFITRKVYRYFVNDQPDEAKVQWLASRFYNNNYAISQLLEDIFTSDWFYDPKNIGVKIKSPVELLAGLRRVLPMQISNAQVQLLLQRGLGQVLLYPPNVAGWPGGKNWIDSSSLMLRMRTPQLLAGAELLTINPKGDDDLDMGMATQDMQSAKGNALLRRFNSSSAVDWTTYNAQYADIKRPELYAAVEKRLLQTPAGTLKPDMIKRHLDAGSREQYLKTLTLSLLCTPEYQMC